jgi:transposase
VHLAELSVMEQRYQAIMAVVHDGWKITEVAERLGVTRQAVHRWIARYDAGGLLALADRLALATRLRTPNPSPWAAVV